VTGVKKRPERVNRGKKEELQRDLEGKKSTRGIVRNGEYHQVSRQNKDMKGAARTKPGRTSTTRECLERRGKTREL